MVGIYKITNPNNYVYIGQSKDIHARWSAHKRAKKGKRYSMIALSILKHGSEKHVFELVHELPTDVNRQDMNRIELFYIEHYRSLGFTMMNTGECNVGGTITEQARKNLSDSHKGQPAYWKGKKMPQELKDKLSAAQKGKKQSKETISKRQATIKEKAAQGYIRKKPGKINWTEEGRARFIKAVTGRPWTEEQKKKISESQKARWAIRKLKTTQL